MTRVFDDDERDDRDTPEPPEGPRLELTTVRIVALSAVAGAVLGWAFVRTLETFNQVVPVTPIMLVVLLFMLSIACFAGAFVLKRRINDPDSDVTAEQGVLAVTLGKAMLMSGALLFGGHLVYVALNIGRMDAPMPRSRVVNGAAMVAVSALLAVSGWVLERACVVGKDSDDS